MANSGQGVDCDSVAEDLLSSLKPTRRYQIALDVFVRPSLVGRRDRAPGRKWRAFKSAKRSLYVFAVGALCTSAACRCRSKGPARWPNSASVEWSARRRRRWFALTIPQETRLGLPSRDFKPGLGSSSATRGLSCRAGTRASRVRRDRLPPTRVGLAVVDAPTRISETLESVAAHKQPHVASG